MNALASVGVEIFQTGVACVTLMLKFRSRHFTLPTRFCAVVCLAILPVALRAAPPQPPTVLLGHANVLPLAIDSSVEVRKSKTDFLEAPEVTGIKVARNENGEDQSLAFERRRLLFGAITPSDARSRYGNYLAFYWRSRRPGHFTARLEYRQQKLGAVVQAREVDYVDGDGSHVTRFQMTGDDYFEQGRVSAWRFVIIEDGRRIVALKQSYLWR